MLEQELFKKYDTQFALPRGLKGWIAGKVMEFYNHDNNKRAAEILEIQSEDRILEIGFGPGELIELAANQATKGLVAGIDPSETMLKMATRRNRQFINEGRVVLKLGKVTQIPFEDKQFDKVCVVNNFQFWEDYIAGGKEIFRVLKDDGILHICQRMRNPERPFIGKYGYTLDDINDTEDQIRKAGFKDVDRGVHMLPRESMAAFHIRKIKP